MDTNLTNYAIINSALANDFSDRIPTATQENMFSVGEMILNYEPARNQFLNALFNKIGLTLINALKFDNPFARYKGQNIPYGDTIEDIYVGLITGYEYDKTNTDPFGQREPNVTAIYHTINVELQYKVTVNDSLLRRAFRSANGLTDLITQIVSSTIQSANYDEYLNTMAMLSSSDILGYNSELGARSGDDAQDGKTLLMALKDTASSMRFMNTGYNKSGVETYTPFDQQLIIIRADWKNKIDVDVLAGLFNLSKVDITQRMIEVPCFLMANPDTTATEKYIEDPDKVAMLVDERGFKIHQALVDGGLIYNPQGKYTNHFYNNWEVISWSLYRNAVAFTFTASA